MSQHVIATKAYGEVPVQDKQVIHFPSGLYGFESITQYALLDSHTPPFFWLQSLADANLAFILINPYVVARDYVLDISGDDFHSIGNPDPDNLLVFAIVTIPSDQRDTSCNLQGPVIINREARIGRQSISLDTRWEIKHYFVSRREQ